MDIAQWKTTQWMLEQINKAETMEGLNYLADIIRFDADHGSEYALSPLVEELRKAWIERKKIIETLEIRSFE